MRILPNKIRLEKRCHPSQTLTRCAILMCDAPGGSVSHGGGGFQMMADGRDGMEEPSRRSAFSALASAPHTLSRHNEDTS